MIIKIVSHRKAATRFIFDNGNEVSMIFGDMTYSDNYDLWKKHPDALNRADDEVGLLESTTVEIMFSGNEAFVKRMNKLYDGDGSVCGYVPVSEIPKILKAADSRVYKTTK